MSEYVAPIKDMQFVLRELVDLPQLLRLPEFNSLEIDVLQSVLQEAGAFAAEVLSPLNRLGDRTGAQLQAAAVITPPGWREAYQRFAADGWNGLACSSLIGGYGLPGVIAACVEEMWQGANASFALCPMLTRSAIEALDLAAGATLKQSYLSKLVSGLWTGTMNLTEPQAGSDLAAVATRAVPQADGSYRINGQKIFITYGEHDLTENIIHMILARTPNAPAGVKGISLFLVPKFLLKADGTPDVRNDLRCLSLEHKLGIHASPTCVMQYGGGEDGAGGAIGWLVGEENRGLEYMFIMMNMARFNVGIQGIGIAERAYQQARSYARDRRQGAEAGSRGGASVPIIRHPDVRRMLLEMKSTIEAMRCLACIVAEAADHARANPDAGARGRAHSLVGLLIPVVKGWSTESAVTLASIGVQIHGGMGFIEETGAAQYLRDARITSIYEGTTGIQANDLVGRKILRDGGQAAFDLLAVMSQLRLELTRSHKPHLVAIGRSLERAIEALDQAVCFIVECGQGELTAALSAAEPLLMLFGVVCGGWQLGRAALAGDRQLQGAEADRPFYESKILTARFYADCILPRAQGYAHAVLHGADSILGLADEQF